jgi:hypothetical protein
MKETKLQQPFCVLDLLGKRRRRDAELLRGMTEMKMLRNRQHATNVAQLELHGINESANKKILSCHRQQIVSRYTIALGSRFRK